MKVLLVFHTKTGHTLEAAKAIEEGVRYAGHSINVVPVKECDPKHLEEYDTIIFGTPTWFNGACGPIKSFLHKIPKDLLSDKMCSAFAVMGGSGGHKAVEEIGLMVSEKGCIDFVPGPIVQAGGFLSIWKGYPISRSDLIKCREYGGELLE
jgi:flavodoxin